MFSFKDCFFLFHMVVLCSYITWCIFNNILHYHEIRGQVLQILPSLLQDSIMYFLYVLENKNLNNQSSFLIKYNSVYELYSCDKWTNYNRNLDYSYCGLLCLVCQADLFLNGRRNHNILLAHCRLLLKHSRLSTGQKIFILESDSSFPLSAILFYHLYF